MISLVNDAESELLQFLCQHPTSRFTLSEIARETNVSKPWVAENIERFHEDSIVTVSERGNAKEVRFNRDSDAALRLKQVINLEAVRRSGVLDDIIDVFAYPDAVILYGSFVRGEDVEHSDVDIAVVSTGDGDVEAEILGRTVSAQMFDPGDLPSNMLETLANGIILYGYLEVE